MTFRPPSNELRNSLANAAQTYADQLKASAGASRYLTDRRGLKSETIDEFVLGCVDDPLQGDEKYRGRISIPYMTRSGIVNMRYRCIVDHDCKETGCPKYLGPPGLNPPLFNVDTFLSRHEDFIYVTEGEMDAITAAQVGLPAVGVPGVGAWRDSYALAFRGYRKVIVLADGDQAGDEFVNGKVADEDGRNVRKPGVAARLAALVGEVKVISMPPKKDVNDVLLERGADGLRELVKV